MWGGTGDQGCGRGQCVRTVRVECASFLVHVHSQTSVDPFRMENLGPGIHCMLMHVS